MPKRCLCPRGGLCPKAYAQGLMPKEELMPKRGLMPKKTETKPHHDHAVVTPGAATPDYFLVSRATRKILSPVGAPLMYSPYAQKGGLCPKGAYAQGGAYAQKAYAQRLMPRGELMPKQSLCPKTWRTKRTTTTQWTHLKRPRPITSSSLARHGKFSEPLARP